MANTLAIKMNVDQLVSALGMRPTAKPRNHLPCQIKGFTKREVIRHGIDFLINVCQNGNAVESPAKYQNNLLMNRKVILNQMSM